MNQINYYQNIENKLTANLKCRDIFVYNSWSGKFEVLMPQISLQLTRGENRSWWKGNPPTPTRHRQVVGGLQGYNVLVP